MEENIVNQTTLEQPILVEQLNDVGEVEQTAPLLESLMEAEEKKVSKGKKKEQVVEIVQEPLADILESGNADTDTWKSDTR